MRKFIFLLFSIIVLLFILPTFRHNSLIAHAADCSNGRVILSQDPIPHNFNGPLSVTVDNKCFVLKQGYIVVAFPNGLRPSCRGGIGANDICSQATVVNCSGNNGACNALNAQVDFSSIANRDTSGPWTLEICPNSNNNVNNPDCTSPAATTSFTYGSADTNPIPKIQLTQTSKCYFQVGSQVYFTVTNLIPGQKYEWFWLDEWTFFHNGHPAIGSVTANNASMTIEFTQGGNADQKGGNPPLKRTICIDGDGFGQRQQPPNNCIDLYFSTGPVKEPGLCAGNPTPTQGPAECETKLNGQCVNGSSQAVQCPTGMNIISDGQTHGCSTGACCVPKCSQSGSQCGDTKGTPYCCNTNTVCNIAAGEQLGTCQGCVGKGGTCSTKNQLGACCTQQNLICGNIAANGNGTCLQCIQDGQKTCDSQHPCCSGNNNCTNAGQCVSACTEGMTCKTDQECCQGFTCQNGGCSKNTNVAVPSFPPVNWCQNGNCNTALGSWPYDPAPFVKTLFAIVLSLAGGIAVLTIIYGGYVYMTSQGTPERLQHGQELITAAVVGLLFTIFSLVILQTIGFDLLHIPGFGQ